ncbi:hypothetical protein [Paenibacillus castaneae]|uniref:hypothetical protein n=1 Tax=Paenibacillus castaneae TaxID=474957 RepID=UPI001ABA8430|nr:hypothetical protein [Paenibacillus castaneae]
MTDAEHLFHEGANNGTFTVPNGRLYRDHFTRYCGQDRRDMYALPATASSS